MKVVKKELPEGVKKKFVTKIGKKVKIGDILFKIYAKDLLQAKEVEQKLLQTIFIN